MIVEAKDHNAVHMICDNKERADWILVNLIPIYIRNGFFADKTLTTKDFLVIEKLPKLKNR